MTTGNKCHRNLLFKANYAFLIVLLFIFSFFSLGFILIIFWLLLLTHGKILKISFCNWVFKPAILHFVTFWSCNTPFYTNIELFFSLIFAFKKRNIKLHLVNLFAIQCFLGLLCVPKTQEFIFICRFKANICKFANFWFFQLKGPNFAILTKKRFQMTFSYFLWNIFNIQIVTLAV